MSLEGSLIIQFLHLEATHHQLLLGSRNDSTRLAAINVITVLEKSDKQYPGILQAHERLSESAHPNWEGITLGYSKIDHDEYVTRFRNRWVEITEGEQDQLISTCMTVFEAEYQDVWPALFEELEAWIEQNDQMLEQTRPQS